MDERYQLSHTSEDGGVNSHENQTEVRSKTPPLTMEMARRMWESNRDTVSTGSISNNANVPRSNWTFFKDDRLLCDFDPSNDALMIR